MASAATTAVDSAAGSDTSASEKALGAVSIASAAPSPPMAVAPDVLRANKAAHAAAVKASEERWVCYGPPAAAAMDPRTAAAAVRWRHISYPSPPSHPKEGEREQSPAWQRPFGVGDLARVSLAPVVSRAECDALVAEADANRWAWHVPGEGRYGTTAKRAATLLNVQELGMAVQVDPRLTLHAFNA